MRPYVRIPAVAALVFVVILSTAVVGSRAQGAAVTASAVFPPVEHTQMRLLASGGDYRDGIDVIAGGPSVYTCGVESCSYYVNRRGTKSAADFIERNENTVNVAVAGVATGACAATGAGVAAVTVCTTAANAAAAHVLDEIKAAGERGECLRLHYYFYPTLLPATPSSDNSGYCRNG